jgi:penicillin-binding protein 1A
MQRSQRRVRVTNPADGGFLYWLLKLYVFGAVAFVLLLVAALPMVYLAVAASVPAPPNLRAYSQRAALETTVLASDGQVLTTLADNYRYLVKVEEIPPLLVKAFLAAEDRSFFGHGGVDFRGVMRAALANLRAGGVRQGGSTITQQVAKSYLSSERTIQRKVKELVLARRIEARFGKRDILYLYLNHIFLGANAYGVKAAARVYFDKDLDRLTISEMAMLAGLVRAPSRYSPRASMEAALRRRNQVLDAMREVGFIDRRQRDQAAAEPLHLASTQQSDPMLWLAPHFTEHVRRQLLQRYGRERVYSAGWRVETTVDLTLQALAQAKTMQTAVALDKRQGWRGRWHRLRTPQETAQFLKAVRRLYDTSTLEVDRPYPTVIDKVAGSRVQARIGAREVEIPSALMEWAAPYSRTSAENERSMRSIKDVVAPGDVVWTVSPPRWLRRKAWGTASEKTTPMALYQVPRVEGTMYTYDHQTGYTLAMVGGLDYDRSSYNRCVQACRQPGSVYKPIYYSLALDREDLSMATILHDKPYEPEPGEQWNPQNVHGTIDGKVTMHASLVRSLNLPSIELLNKVGAQEAANWARRLGFTTPIHADKALALGASCVKTDELTRAFGTFVRGGTQMDPLYARRILDRNGVAIEDHTTPEDPLLEEDDRLDRLWARSTHTDRQVIDRRTAFLITKLLRDSVLYGIAARCQIVPAPTGGKGGTSSDTMDVWFVGFTSQWVNTAWVGDDTYQRPLGEKEASYTSSIPMWAEYMRDAVGKRPHRELPLDKPDGLKSAIVDSLTGGAPKPDSKPVRIYFRPGSYTPPKEEGGS